MKRSIPPLMLVLGLAACGSSTPEDVSPDAEDRYEAQEITIMSFNVENLFDNLDDPGKNDSTYLPAAHKSDPEHIAACEQIEVQRWRDDCLYLDWSDDAVAFKLEQLAKTILQVNDGFGPDVVAFQEVENIRILDRLRDEYLAGSGYAESILIEGDDLRGIDVAFLSRLPLAAEPVLHPLDMNEFPDRADDTRGVLEATFELPDGALLTGYSVHFPAPFHPIEMRWLAYEHLNTIRARLPEDRHVFAAGDFNTPQREVEGTTILDDMARPYWTIAHETGCKGCRGTNYFARADSWSFLDMIFYSPSAGAASEWRIKRGGVYIADSYDDQLNEDGTPKRFNLEGRYGVSDHLPLVMTLETVNPD
ncbi:MAG: endonuclease/exonuclease/phosphatase family protein [Pseudomonadota bacterium]